MKTDRERKEITKGLLDAIANLNEDSGVGEDMKEIERRVANILSKQAADEAHYAIARKAVRVTWRPRGRNFEIVIHFKVPIDKFDEIDFDIDGENISLRLFGEKAQSVAAEYKAFKKSLERDIKALP